MRLSDITPVILTYNEAPNIGRTLDRLRWAPSVVVVDSQSTDETLAIARSFPNAHVFERAFDTHAGQWNFAVGDTGIETPWVLALDADYLLSPELVSELEALEPLDSVGGYSAPFTYCVFGRPLRASLYPPVTVLFRRGRGSYVQDGHTQRAQVDGAVLSLKGRILHDDRKSLSHWLRAQERYTSLEAEHIAASTWGQLGAADKLRRLILPAPLAVFVYCLLVRGLVLDGRAGLYYALQRLLAEVLLSLKLLEGTLKL